MKRPFSSKVIAIQHLTPTTYLLRLERHGMPFKAGQYLVIKNPADQQAREYSIFSSEADPYLEVLIREIEGGDLSKTLKGLPIGTELMLSGPYGFFVLREEDLNSPQQKPLLFIATGTGISPYHSMVRTNPTLTYKVIHGVRYKEEAYQREDFDSNCYLVCTSRDSSGHFHGRVTVFLRDYTIDPKSIVFLCGNSEMVAEVTDLLESRGMSPNQIRTEIFF